MAIERTDPEVKALTLPRLFEDVGEFSLLLENKVSEHKIHNFLAHHSYFFNDHIRLFDTIPLLSKIKLGSNHEIDFAICDHGSYGPEWKLIEIESPKYSLFNKSGDPSQELNHALRQAHDWLTWITNNIDYARKTFAMVEYPLCIIFMGRRSELTNETAARLRSMNHQNRTSIHIHTFDNLIDGALSVVNLIQSDGIASWTTPMKALSHKKWMSVKEGVESQFESYKKHPRIFKRDLKLLLKERADQHTTFRDVNPFTPI